MANTNNPMFFAIPWDSNEPFTVEKLISALEELPPETPVYRGDSEYGPEPIVQVEYLPVPDRGQPHGIEWRVEIS